MNLHIKVKPNARQNRISLENDVLVVRVNAPAIDGKANKALLVYLSEVFDIPKSAMTIGMGAGSKFKRIEVPSEYDASVKRVIAGLRGDKAPR